MLRVPHERQHRDHPHRLMQAYTYERAMQDAARLSRAIRAGRVAVYRPELDGVLALAGETWPHRELLGTGLCALYDWDADEWLVDENWLSPKQRRVLHEAVKRRVRGV